MQKTNINSYVGSCQYEENIADTRTVVFLSSDTEEAIEVSAFFIFFLRLLSLRSVASILSRHLRRVWAIDHFITVHKLDSVKLDETLFGLTHCNQSEAI